MWIADQWKDYEVIDCSKGEKLERWGQYTLVRPDPQVIWDTPKTERGWKHMNGHYHRSKKGGGEWEFFSLPEQWQIHYKELTFNLKPFSFKHTGLFPEQATNWDWFSEKIRNAGRPIKVLNLFAYTGGVSDNALHISIISFASIFATSHRQSSIYQITLRIDACQCVFIQ